MHMSFDMKFLVKVTINRLNHLVVIKKKKKKNVTLFPHSFASRTYRDITYGIKAKVTTLGPNGLIYMQVCCEVCVFD